VIRSTLSGTQQGEGSKEAASSDVASFV